VNLTLHKLWENTNQSNRSSLTGKERWMEIILYDKEDDTAGRQTLQNGRTLKEIIKEAKNMEEKEKTQNNMRITY
jgi:hypothetical protein